MRFFAVIIVVLACLAALVCLAVFAHWDAPQMFCPIVILGLVAVGVSALIMGIGPDDLT